ncbi:MAG: winged helix-turn-helix domain-containing protein, partial [Xanthobacteraceae bacterium]
MDFRFAEYEIDIGRHELRRAGEVVAIEPQVFDLLVYLVRHRDRIISKDELIDAVWHGRIVSDAALSSCISAARRAIGDNGDDQLLIRTLHKRGFRFVGRVDDDISAAAPADDARPARKAATARDSRERTGDAEASRVQLALPDKPSIAVLPFQNMSGDPEQDYFADGLTEDIITGLSQQRWFFVIARNSSFTYKGKAVDVKQVGRELG